MKGAEGVNRRLDPLSVDKDRFGLNQELAAIFIFFRLLRVRAKRSI